MGWSVLADHFDTFEVLARRSWTTGITADDLETAGVASTVQGVQSWLDAGGHDAWEVVWLQERNSSTHLLWLGLRRRSPRA
jgi:hypothetical protein